MTIAYKYDRIRRWAPVIGWPAALRFEMLKTARRPTIAIHHPAIRRRLVLRSASSDVSVFEDVFIRHGFDVAIDDRPAVILDGGANCGLGTLCLALRYSDAIVVAVEPSAENCAQIALNTAGLDNVRILQTALWSRPTRLTIENGDAEPWSYRCRETDADDPAGFDGLDIDTILTRLGLPACDLVKLDIEGAETEVFRTGGRWLDDAKAILVEPHGDAATALIHERCPAPDWHVQQVGEKLLLKRAGQRMAPQPRPTSVT